ncbi:acyltransferase family protein [Evansella sp. AB-rgal1]|uniref:acyltransferase family protein n=1 Tax=Evansella sp. AB-rgal1 TaxID=3242696 RepID=UPI00359DAFC5
MENRLIINEAYWLRALSCLAVVITHAVNTTLANYEATATQFEQYILIFIRFMAFFGTPTFVFISELILARAYPNGVPKHFFQKRIKFLLMPFISMAIIFAFITTETLQGAIYQAFLNIFLAGYYGYFILIIFQFYLLHVILHNKLQRWSPKLIISISFLINVLYLGFFHYTDPIQLLPFAEQIWKKGHWLPFLGWIFYFTLGFYCGKNYEVFKAKLYKFRKVLPIFPIITLFIIILSVRTDLLTVVSSKRMDMILYTTSIIFVTVYISSTLNKVPRVILFISKHSFHIYLIHKIFLYYLEPIHFLHPFVYFTVAVVYSVIGSLIVSKLFSRFRLSTYIIGKTLPVPLKNKNRKSWQKPLVPKKNTPT